MREIKFRVWDKKEKRMMYPDELIAISPTGNEKLNYARLGSNGDYLWDKGVLLQYTGLKDKNKEEVYDTDIIKIDNSILEVVKVDGGFIVRGINIEYENNIIDEWKRYRDKIIKLGNKYENPELLEAKDE